MSTVSAGYKIDSKTDIKAIDTSTLITGYARLSIAEGDWYWYNGSSTASADDITILLPSSGVGRWYRIHPNVLSAEISDLNATIEAKLNSSLTASSTVSVTYNSTAHTFTVAVINSSIGDSQVSSLSQSKISGLTTALSGKTDVGHSHSESDVTGLITDLSNKASITHSHAESDVTGLTADLSSINTSISSLTTTVAGKAATTHSHAESDVTSLVTDLASKASVTHTHTESDVTSLTSDLSAISSSLNGKAAAVHTHSEADVTALVTDLAGKASSSHTHIKSNITDFPIVNADIGATAAIAQSKLNLAITDNEVATAAAIAQSKISGLTTSLAGKASATHSHAESDVTSLVSDLASKASATHSHTESDVTSLVTDLAGKAPTVHTHVKSSITDLPIVDADISVSANIAQSKISGLTTSLSSKANSTHTHAESDVTSLTTDLSTLTTAVAGKAATSHTHAEADVTSLVTDLSNKSAVGHTHVKTNITDLPIVNADVSATAAIDQSKLNLSITDTEVSSSANIAQSKISGLTTSLSGKANSTHSHAESEVTSLVTDLASKANATHTHAESDVTSLVTDLAGKAASSHTHVIANITDYSAGGGNSTSIRRQSVYTGSFDATTRQANALSIASGLSITLTASSGTPFVVAFGNGYSSTGLLINVVAATSNMTFSSLTANTTLYLYLDYASSTLTTGFSALQPTSARFAPSSPATDQHWFDQMTNTMYRWSGSAWVAFQRVFIGQCVTGASTVTSVITYPYLETANLYQWHQDSRTYEQNIRTAGGTIREARLQIVDQYLIKELADTGLNSLVRFLLIFGSDGFTGSLIPIYKNSGDSNPTATSITSSDFYSFGIKGNGTGYINSNFSLSWATDNAHMIYGSLMGRMYDTTSSASIQGCSQNIGSKGFYSGNLGNQSTGSIVVYPDIFVVSTASGNVYTSSSSNSYTTDSVVGVHSFSRITSTARCMLNGRIIYQNTSFGTSYAIPTTTPMIFAYDNSGTIQYQGTYSQRLVSYGYGLTLAQDIQIQGIYNQFMNRFQ